MMNAVGIWLVLTSLVAAGVWSPAHTTTKLDGNDNNRIVKEGHRVVVVEYDQEDQPITKVSISPEAASHHFNSEVSSTSATLDDLRDKLRESSDEWRTPKELICDAYGKCKHRIAEAVGKAKDSVADAAHRAEEAVGRTKDSVAGAAHRAEEAVAGAAETVRSGVREVEGEARETAKDVRDLGKTIGSDVAKNVTWFVGRVLSPESLNPVSGTLYVLGFAVAYGTGMWVTFAEGQVLAKALPMSQFAVAQSKLFPVYFRVTAVSLGTAVFWFVMTHRGEVVARIPELLQLYNLSAALLLVLINAFFLEPRATKVMFERMKLEKEEGRGREEANPEQQSEHSEQKAVTNRISELSVKLKKLNTLSSALNILSLMCLSWHVFYLGIRLHLTF